MTCRTRIHFIFLPLLLWCGLVARVSAADTTEVQVFRSPQCDCCEGWIRYLRERGFTVAVNDVEDIVVTRREQAVPDHLGGCHTAKVAGYILGGHVPVEDIQRLLAERPALTGLFVPGMPKGAPGMEGKPERFEVIALDLEGKESVFAIHTPPATVPKLD